MAFVCQRCLDDNPKILAGIVSYGPCENCHRRGPCADIPLNWLETSNNEAT